MDPSELLQYLAEGLVDDPEAVEVDRFEESDGSITLELAVGPDDYGKVIGRASVPARRTIARSTPDTVTRMSTESSEAFARAT